jgi:hypothetical protein
MTLTILTVNLITGAISEYMISYKNHYKPFIFTLFGMAIIVLIFYPLFLKLEGWVKSFSIKAVRSGKSFAGRYLGLLLTFITGMIILFHFYARMWYHIDFVKVLFNGTAGGYM